MRQKRFEIFCHLHSQSLRSLQLCALHSHYSRLLRSLWLWASNSHSQWVCSPRLWASHSHSQLLHSLRLCACTFSHFVPLGFVLRVAFSISLLSQASCFTLALSVALLCQALCFELAFSVASPYWALRFTLAFSVALLRVALMISREISVSARQPRCGECVLRQECVPFPMRVYSWLYHANKP